MNMAVWHALHIVPLHPSEYAVVSGAIAEAVLLFIGVWNTQKPTVWVNDDFPKVSPTIMYP